MEGVSRSQWRDAPPTHFIFRIELFSRLSASWSERYESGVVTLGSYKWKLVLYPNGNTQKGGGDHISLYLALAPDSHAKLKKEILVSYTLLLFDHVRERYFSIQDVCRLDKGKSKLGFDKFLPLKSFIDPSSGFLVNDTCVFGADIFVMENTPKEHCLSMMPSTPSPYKHTWKIEKFSWLESKEYYSKKFTTRGHDLRLKLHPKCCGNLSLYLELADSGTPIIDGSQVLIECKLRVVDQGNKNHNESAFTHCFTAVNVPRGYANFMPLTDLNKPGAGYLVNDRCIVEAEVTVLGSTKASG